MFREKMAMEGRITQTRGGNDEDGWNKRQDEKDREKTGEIVHNQVYQRSEDGRSFYFV